MDLIAADQQLAPQVLTAAAELAAAAASGGWYLLQFNPVAVTGRAVSMPPGPDRQGCLTRGGAGAAVIELAYTRTAKDPSIIWLPATEHLAVTVRRCLAASLPCPATAMRVLTCGGAVRYRVEMFLNEDTGSANHTALFEQTRQAR